MTNNETKAGAEKWWTSNVPWVGSTCCLFPAIFRWDHAKQHDPWVNGLLFEVCSSLTCLPLSRLHYENRLQRDRGNRRSTSVSLYAWLPSVVTFLTISLLCLLLFNLPSLLLFVDCIHWFKEKDLDDDVVLLLLNFCFRKCVIKRILKSPIHCIVNSPLRFYSSSWWRSNSRGPYSSFPFDNEIILSSSLFIYESQTESPNCLLSSFTSNAYSFDFERRIDIEITFIAVKMDPSLTWTLFFSKRKKDSKKYKVTLRTRYPLTNIQVESHEWKQGHHLMPKYKENQVKNDWKTVGQVKSHSKETQRRLDRRRRKKWGQLTIEWETQILKKKAIHFPLTEGNWWEKIESRLSSTWRRAS